MDFRSFMLERVDGEFNFLRTKGVREGQNSQSVKSMNNDAPLIGTNPLSSVYPSNIVENVVDYDDPSYRVDEQTLVGPSLPPHPEASKTLKILGKRKVSFGVPGKALPSKVQKVPARASKVAGEAFCIEFERKRPKSFKIQLLQEIDSLKQDRATVVSKVIPNATMKLVRSDDLEKMSGYRPSSKEEYDQAGDALANASYPFLAEYVVDLYASLEQLLSKKPPSL
nr:hypothetical protein [Tanacetum cinerariifolium]